MSAPVSQGFRFRPIKALRDWYRAILSSVFGPYIKDCSPPFKRSPYPSILLTFSVRFLRIGMYVRAYHCMWPVHPDAS